MLLLPIIEDNLCVSSNIILFKEPHTNILFFLARNRITANFSILDRCQIPVKFKEKHITWIRVSPIDTVAGRKIAPNTGANATKFFTLATKSWKLVANLATTTSNHTLPRDLVIVEYF